MNATVKQADHGNVTITLTNTESETLYIDPDFSFLSAGVESMVLNLTNVQGAKLSVDDNYEAVDADFVSPTSLDNLTSVAAGQSLSRAINLTEIFVVPEKGIYTVSCTYQILEIRFFLFYISAYGNRIDIFTAVHSTVHDGWQ